MLKLPRFETNPTLYHTSYEHSEAIMTTYFQSKSTSDLGTHFEGKKVKHA